MAGCTFNPAPVDTGFAFLNVNVVNLETGEIQFDQTVLLSKGRVTLIAPFSNAAVSESARTIFASQQYLISGISRAVNLKSNEPTGVPAGSRSIQIGDLADLTLVSVNPLTSDINLTNILGIYTEGNWWNKMQLKATKSQQDDQADVKREI